MEYLYCGGRFDFDYRDADFEEKAAKDYRAILLNDVNKLLNNSDTVVLSSRLTYIGSYYFETDGMLDQDIVETENARLRSARLLYSCWITLHARELSQKWSMPHHFKKGFLFTM